MSRSRRFIKDYWFILSMLTGIIAGCIVGAIWPGATCLEPLGTVFINMMFCVVVPMVFCSIASAIANMGNVKRAGKVLGVTVATFMVTAAIAAVLMYILCRCIPLVKGDYPVVQGEVGVTLGVADMIINFFTKPDFAELWSRKAILPLIIAAIIFGFGVQMAGGKETLTAKILADLTNCLMKVIKLITYYAPIGFFGFFAYLVAFYGPELIGDYGRTLIIYYVMCFAYMLISSPIYARFGGGKGAAKVMFQHLLKPAAVSFGTCSSVATIPTNMEVAEDTGISKDVSEISPAPRRDDAHGRLCDERDNQGRLPLRHVSALDFGTKEAILAMIDAVFSSVAMFRRPGRRRYRRELVLCQRYSADLVNLAVPYAVALALGNLVDPPATMVNAAGDYVVSFIVSRYVDGKDWLQKKLHPAKAEKAEE